MSAVVRLFKAVFVPALLCQMALSFEFSGYCQKMCKYGRGGNLCKCTAVHFAGKRQQEIASDGGLGQTYPRYYDLSANGAGHVTGAEDVAPSGWTEEDLRLAQLLDEEDRQGLDPLAQISRARFGISRRRRASNNRPN